MKTGDEVSHIKTYLIVFMKQKELARISSFQTTLSNGTPCIFKYKIVLCHNANVSAFELNKPSG